VVNPTCTLLCAAARLAGVDALVAPIDNIILVTTLWKSNVSEAGADLFRIHRDAGSQIRIAKHTTRISTRLKSNEV
jgi:hypothetical protein